MKDDSFINLIYFLSIEDNFNDNFNMNNMNNMMMGMNFFNNNNIFNNFETGKKTLYKSIINIDNNYFIVTSTKHIKRESNNIINYFYLSLYDYKTMEEINKIEIDEIQRNGFPSDTCSFNINLENNIISIRIIISFDNYYYSYEFKDNELQMKTKFN